MSEPHTTDKDAGPTVYLVTGDVGAACGVYATHEAAEAAVDAHFSEYASGVTVEERGWITHDRWQTYFRVGSFPSILAHATIRREHVRGSETGPPRPPAPTPLPSAAHPGTRVLPTTKTEEAS